MLFGTNNTERMRISSDGHLTVGTTSTDPAASSSETGVALKSGGFVSISRNDSAASVNINKIGYDGSLVDFRKGGSLVGSIGTVSGDIRIGGLDDNHASLRFAASSKAVLPVKSSDGDLSNNTTNLGASTAAFKDFYLAGNIINGGDKYIYSYNTGTSGQVRSGMFLSGTNQIVSFYTAQNERMRIDSSGNVGVGITSPTANLHVRATTDGTEANAHFKIEGAVSTYIAHHWLDSNAYYIGQNSSFRALRIYSGAESSGVNLSSGGTSWGTFSDERLKYDVEPVENAVESLSNLRTVKYRLKDVDSAEDKKKIGLMAQDLVGVLDEVIDPVKKTGDDTEYMSVRYTELVPVLVKAIQEQQTLIESLTDRIAALEE
jgi:hypothetical protein